MGFELLSLDTAAQAVWNARTAADKHAALIEMINGFASKGKGGANVARFTREANAVRNSSTKLDKIAANITLFVGNSVVKF